MLDLSSRVWSDGWPGSKLDMAILKPLCCGIWGSIWNKYTRNDAVFQYDISITCINIILIGVSSHTEWIIFHIHDASEWCSGPEWPLSSCPREIQILFASSVAQGRFLTHMTQRRHLTERTLMKITFQSVLISTKFDFEGRANGPRLHCLPRSAY